MPLSFRLVFGEAITLNALTILDQIRMKPGNSIRFDNENAIVMTVRKRTFVRFRNYVVVHIFREPADMEICVLEHCAARARDEADIAFFRSLVSVERVRCLST